MVLFGDVGIMLDDIIYWIATFFARPGALPYEINAVEDDINSIINFILFSTLVYSTIWIYIKIETSKIFKKFLYGDL
jgi:hypothetical protein